MRDRLLSTSKAFCVQRIGCLSGRLRTFAQVATFALFIAVPASAQIVFDAAGSSSCGCATLSWSHTVGSGNSRILVVGIAVQRSNVPVTSVTYGGQPLTRQVIDSVFPIVEIWTRVSPLVGPATIVVTHPADAIVGGSVSFSGVDQSTPVRATGHTRGFPNPSLSVSVTSSGCVPDLVAAGGLLCCSRNRRHA